MPCLSTKLQSFVNSHPNKVNQKTKYSFKICCNYNIFESLLKIHPTGFRKGREVSKYHHITPSQDSSRALII